MLATLCLLTSALTMAQATGPGAWPLQPQLSRGQELIYRGTYNEESLTPGVQFQKTQRVDTSILVLDAAPQKFDVAILTTVISKTVPRAQDVNKNSSTPSSVRLEVLTLDRLGKLQGQSVADLLPPLDGPPTIECGAFVEVPKGQVGVGHWWEGNEETRPPRKWRVDGVEAVQSSMCVRLVGVQKSDSWDAPRADRSAWERQDTVWISPQSGLVCKFERVIKKREAARVEPTHKTVVTCELTSNLTYSGKLFSERADEIKQARKFQQECEPFLREPDQYRSRLEALMKKVKSYCEAEAPTDYRNAIVQVQKRIDAALRGQSVPNPKIDAAQAPVKFGVGQKVPDFVCTDLVTHGTQRLERVLGKPVVVVFYSPSTEIGLNALNLAVDLSKRHGEHVNVLAFAVTDQPELVQKQHRDRKLPFTILDGNNLTQLFAVDALPRIVVLDSEGVVRGGFTGWGYQIPREVEDVLRKAMSR
jgi:peroxiredoxin